VLPRLRVFFLVFFFKSFLGSCRGTVGGNGVHFTLVYLDGLQDMGIGGRGGRLETPSWLRFWGQIT
jgi:hypothetical protein